MSLSTRKDEMMKSDHCDDHHQVLDTHEHDHSHDNSNEHSHEGGIFGHSHSHAHGKPNELLQTSAASFMLNPAVRITWIGLFTNVLIAVSKGLGGVYFHSQALIADAIHSVSDMVADFLTLATVNVAAKVGSSSRYPLGYGKLESVGAFAVSSVLLLAGVSVGWSSLLQVLGNVLPTSVFHYLSMIDVGHSHSHLFGDSAHTSGHSHSHGGLTDSSAPHASAQVPNINGAWLAAGSIIVKEILFRKTLKVAQATNSKVLIANAWHHRVDSLTSMVAFATITGGHLFNIAWLDAVGGLCVSVLIIKAGWGSFKNAWYELVDRGESKGSELYDKIHKLISADLKMEKDFAGFELVDLSVLPSGANTNIVVTVSVPESLTLLLTQANELEDKLKKSIHDDDKFVRNILVQFRQKKL